jgi:hypothetical protein
MIDVTLGSLGEGNGVFHDLRYTNDQYGGNQNEITFELHNISGNPIELTYTDGMGDEWVCEQTDKIKIKIKGGIEAGEFLNMLHLILETEKIVTILK